ncbi:MAG: CubicO group peptidase (beta-lactamase class C family) [Mariniblastus sp.]
MNATLLKMAALSAVAIAVGINPTNAQEAAVPSQTKSHTNTIDLLIGSYVKNNQFNGSVLVAEHGKIILRKGYGLANREWDIPCEPNTIFRIGSVTKQFTAAVVLQLASEGKLKLDSAMTEYLPDYRKDTGDKVTVHHLLRHTSGIPSYTTPDFFKNESRTPFTVDEFVEKYCSGDSEFEPGSDFRYNNSGYFLLGAIIEQVDGKTYAESVKSRIFDPVGMTDSGYDVHAPIIKRRAQGYEKTPNGYRNAAYLDMGLPFAAGSLYSTIDDLFKWDQSLYADNVLSKESKELMFTPGKSDYGYGFFIGEAPIGKTETTTKIVQHGGGINGFNCRFTRVVGQNHTIVILDNVSMGQYHAKMTNSIINVLNDQPYDLPKKSIVDAISGLAMEQGGATAVAKYRKLKTESPDDYDFDDEEFLNQIGYGLLGDEKIKDAIEIFKLNVEMFPESSNAYDSLGEAYLAANDKELALVNYQKSVELNPENATGVLAINEIEGKSTKLSVEALNAFVGEYEIAPGFILTTTVEEGKLMGQATGQDKIALNSISKTKFLIAPINATITFEIDVNGNTTGLVLDQGGQTVNAKKIN